MCIRDRYTVVCICITKHFVMTKVFAQGNTFLSKYIFTIAQVIEKHRKCQLPAFIVSINFDTVNWNRAQAILAKKWIPQHLIRVIQSLCGKKY